MKKEGVGQEHFWENLIMRFDQMSYLYVFLSESDAMLKSSQSKYAFTNIMDKRIDTIHLIIEQS